MPTYQSRANTCRADTTYLGLYEPSFSLTVNGTAVTALKDSFAIELRSTPPSVCSFAVRDTEITPGHAVEVRDGGTAGKLLFSGRVVSTRFRAATRSTAAYDEVVANNVWLLNRRDVVRETYQPVPGSTLAVNGIVHDIITRFTDGYSIGEIDSSLTITDGVSFENALVGDALKTLADAVGAYVVITPNQKIDIRTGISDGHTITLDGTNTDFWNFRYERDIRQIRNQVIVQGVRTMLAAVANVSDTEITVEDASAFSTTSGGYVAIGTKDSVTQHSFTGISITVQEDGTELHQLTGVTGIVRDHAIGSDVIAIGFNQSAASQTALATVLGGGLSGVAAVYLSEPSLSNAEADVLSQTEVTRLKDERETVSYVTRNKFTVPLKTVTVSLSTPRSISTSVLIESVVIRPRGVFETASPLKFDYYVTATPLRHTLTDVLVEEL